LNPPSKHLVVGRNVICGVDESGKPEIVDEGAVLVESSKIAAIGRASDLRAAHPDAALAGSLNEIVAPGFVNAHHHVGLTPFQLGAPDLPLELWFAVTMGQRSRDAYLDTLYSAFELIASGVTTVQHLHIGRAGGAVIAAQADDILRAYDDIGMRVSYSYAYRDQNRMAYEDDDTFVSRLPDDLAQWMSPWLASQHFPVAEYLEFTQALAAKHANDGRVGVQLAPAGFHWCSDPALKAIGDFARDRNMPIHMHLLETPYQAQYGIQRAEGGAVKHLGRLGLLGPRLTLGHGVWLTEDDADLLAETGTCVCHNASSNMRLASGRAPCKHLLSRGIPVGLGIDEAGLNDDRDMLQEMRLVSHLHKDPGIRGAGLTAAQIFQMATESGARTTPFAGRIGRLEIGMEADLVLHDWATLSRPYLEPSVGIVDAMIQRGRHGSVRSAMVGGNWIYRDGSFTGVDRNAILDALAGAMARPISATDSEKRRRGLELLPHLQKLYDSGVWAGVTGSLDREARRRAWADVRSFADNED
jgi:5-methylthioadenosine/S-adenosylhomocysteine deaminase